MSGLAKHSRIGGGRMSQASRKSQTIRNTQEEFVDSLNVFQKKLYNFNANEYVGQRNARAAQDMAKHLLKTAYESDRKKIPTEKEDLLGQIVEEVYQNYYDVPFHNFGHALDVAQLMLNVLVELKDALAVKLDGKKMFYCVLSALCHDMGHPGLVIPAMEKLGLDQSFRKAHPSLEDYHISEVDGKLCLKLIPTLLGDNKTDITEFKTWMKTLITATNFTKGAELNAWYDGKNAPAWVEAPELKQLTLLIRLADMAKSFREYSAYAQSKFNVNCEFYWEEELEKLKVDFLKENKTIEEMSQFLVEVGRAPDHVANRVINDKFDAVGKLLPLMEKVAAPDVAKAKWNALHADLEKLYEHTLNTEKKEKKKKGF